MAIKRYWRLIGANTSGGSALDLSECRLYEGGVIADAGATLTCTLAPSTGALSALRDGVATGVVSWPAASYSAPGWALNWDFGVGGGVDTPKLRLGSGASQATWLLDATLQYCTDGVTWVTYMTGLSGINYPGANALTPAPDASAPDMYSANNSLLLLGNGANGSTSIVDSSVTNPKAVTAFGDAKISTAQSKFGGSSIYFGGAGYLSIPDSADFAFGSGDYTLEAWCYVPSTVTVNQVIMGQWGAGNLGWNMLFLGTNRIALEASSTGAYEAARDAVTANNIFANNTWFHVAITRYGDLYKIWVNGVLAASLTIAGTLFDASSIVTIGAANNNANYFTGYLDDLRITKGLARYTANFTPPGSIADALIIPNAYTARATRLAPVPERLLPAVELPNTTASTHSREYTHCDIYYGGDGSITGTVKEKHSPANTPLYRRVLLIDERSQQVIRETWSDATTGNFAFHSIKIGPAYSTLSFDHLHNYRAVVADNLSA